MLGAGSDLQQVFLNICNNASHASGGRPVTIDTQRIKLVEKRQLSHGSLCPGKYAVVSIRDTGPGIPETAKHRLFEPFFTTKAGGTGLGLSTAWEIVQDHGGTIDVENVPEGGARFSVWLPEMHANVSVPIIGNGARILLLAEPDRLSAEEDLLAELGYEPLGFTLSADAGALREAVGDCDAVLVATRQARLVDELVCGIGPALGNRPLLLATPEGHSLKCPIPSMTLNYPIRPSELSDLLSGTSSMPALAQAG